MSPLESPLGIRRRTAVGAVAGLGTALLLVGGSLSGLSDDIFHFRGWSQPSVADRGGAVGLAAEQPGTVADRRTGPAPARTAIAIVEAGRVLRGDGVNDRPQRVSVRRTGSRPGARTRRPGGAPSPAGPQIVAQTPPAASPAPAAAPAPAAPAPAPAAAPEQVAAVPVTRESPGTRNPSTPEPTRTAGNSGKVKTARQKDSVSVSEPEVQTRIGSTAGRVEEPREVAAPSVPGTGPNGQGAPGQQRKASSPVRGKHDRDHHGVGHVRGPGPKKH